MPLSVWSCRALPDVRMKMPDSGAGGRGNLDSFPGMRGVEISGDKVWT
jgi:hypothetical protein